MKKNDTGEQKPVIYNGKIWFHTHYTAHKCMQDILNEFGMHTNDNVIWGLFQGHFLCTKPNQNVVIIIMKLIVKIM